MYSMNSFLFYAPQNDGKAISIAPKELFEIDFGIFKFSVTQTVISGFLALVILLIFFVVVRVFFIPRWKKQPFKKSRFRIIMEKFVSLFDNTAKEQTHRYANFTSSLYIGLASFIAVATLIELIGLRPATSDLNLTFSLGFITFLTIFFIGFAKKKHKRLLHYLNPINTLTDAIIPITMGIRLFASVFSGYIILHLLYSNVFLSVGLPVVANVLLTLVHAAIQAYLFMFLSMSFINEAIE